MAEPVPPALPSEQAAPLNAASPDVAPPAPAPLDAEARVAASLGVAPPAPAPQHAQDDAPPSNSNSQTGNAELIAGSDHALAPAPVATHVSAVAPAAASPAAVAPATMPQPPPAPAVVAAVSPTALAPAPAPSRQRMPPPLPTHLQEPPPPPMAPPARPGVPPTPPAEGSLVLPLPGALLAMVPTMFPDELQDPQVAPGPLGTETSEAGTVPEPAYVEAPPELPADVAAPMGEAVLPEALPSQLTPPSRPAEPLPLPLQPPAVGAPAAADTVPGVPLPSDPMVAPVQPGVGLSASGQLLSQPLSLSVPLPLSASGLSLPVPPPLAVGIVPEATPAAEMAGGGGAGEQECTCCPGCAQAAMAPAAAPAASPASPFR